MKLIKLSVLFFICSVSISARAESAGEAILNHETCHLYLPVDDLYFSQNLNQNMTIQFSNSAGHAGAQVDQWTHLDELLSQKGYRVRKVTKNEFNSIQEKNYLSLQVTYTRDLNAMIIAPNTVSYGHCRVKLSLCESDEKECKFLLSAKETQHQIRPLMVRQGFVELPECNKAEEAAINSLPQCETYLSMTID